MSEREIDRLIYIYIYIHIHIYIERERKRRSWDTRPVRQAARRPEGEPGPWATLLKSSTLKTGARICVFITGIHYRGVQSEGGAVDGGSII